MKMNLADMNKYTVFLVFNTIAQNSDQTTRIILMLEACSYMELKFVQFKKKITFLFYAVLHCSLLHCCLGVEALFPTLPPAVNEIISICFARHTITDVSCCTKEFETG